MTVKLVADVSCEPNPDLLVFVATGFVSVAVHDGRVELLAKPCALTSEQALRVASALIRAVRATDDRFENRNTETMLMEADR